MNDIKNIYCVGRNYSEHAAELGNDIPTKPMIFSKPTHALHPAKGELSLPFHLGEIHYEVELVVKMAADFQENKPLHEVVEGVAVGIDWTARDIQSQLKEKGHPWLISKGFKGSAVVSEFMPFTSVEDFRGMEFSLLKNGQPVQVGKPMHMIFSLEELLLYIHNNLGLGKGDLVFTGTPEGVGAARVGDVFELKLVNEKSGVSKWFGPLNVVG